MRVLTADQMRAADAAAVAETGDVALMRAAGEAIAGGLRQLAPGARKIVAFAGPGNNGGDAFAALAALGGPSQRVVYAMPAPRMSPGRRDAQRQALATGVVLRPFPLTYDDAVAAIEGADIAIDALLGTGARPRIANELEIAVRALGSGRARVLAIDIPTGVDATTGAAAPNAVRADATISLGAPKLGLLLEPARSCCGALYVGDIGIDAQIEALGGDVYDALDAEEFLDLLPSRGEESDKRSAGAPLVIAGSAQFPGAGVLCARGAARAGAGYVTVACPESAAASIRGHLIEQVVVTYDDHDPRWVRSCAGFSRSWSVRSSPTRARCFISESISTCCAEKHACSRRMKANLRACPAKVRSRRASESRACARSSSAPVSRPYSRETRH